MSRRKRIEQFDPREVTTLFVTQRCVRRAFLTGDDPVSGVDYTYRREMIRKRMESLSSAFGIDVLAYSILSNHMHLVLRNRPDIVASWDDVTAAMHWLRVFPGKRIDQDLGVPTELDIEKLVGNRERLEVLRIRLSDPSWYMKTLCETIARRCNQMDKATGHFWEGRFKAQKVLDEISVTATCMYTDLNPFRAGLFETIETSMYTSAYDRIQTLLGKSIVSAALDTPIPTQEEASKTLMETAVENMKELKQKNRKGQGKQVSPDGWLAPVQLKPLQLSPDKKQPQEGQRSYVDPECSKSGLRPSDRGFLTFSVEEYILLLDWTAKQKGRDGQAVMPEELGSVLNRLGVDIAEWRDLVANFSRYFAHSGAIGTAKSLREDAERRGRRPYQGERQLATAPPGLVGPPRPAAASLS